MSESTEIAHVDVIVTVLVVRPYEDVSANLWIYLGTCVVGYLDGRVPTHLHRVDVGITAAEILPHYPFAGDIWIQLITTVGGYPLLGGVDVSIVDIPVSHPEVLPNDAVPIDGWIVLARSIRRQVGLGLRSDVVINDVCIAVSGLDPNDFVAVDGWVTLAICVGIDPDLFAIIISPHRGPNITYECRAYQNEY